MNDEKCHAALAGYVLRLAIGGLLLIAGIGKFSGGVEAFVTSSVTMFDGTLVPMFLAKAYLSLIPLLEVVVGGLLILGLFTNIAAWVASFMFALFIVGLAATKSDMMTNSFIFMFASLWLTKVKSGALSLDHWVCRGKC